MNIYKFIVGAFVLILGFFLDEGAYASTQEIRVLVTEQSAEGMTEADMTQEFINRIADHYKKRVIALSDFSERQAAAAQKSINMESVYLTDRGKKLLVLRLNQVEPPFYNLVVGGIVGEKFVRVSCIWNFNKRISASQGECGKKINAIFYAR